MDELTAEIKPIRKISMIWLLPVLVAIIGSWVMFQYYSSQGPLVEISLTTAEGLEAGRTRVRALSVDIGVVEDIQLEENLEGVRVTARLSPDTQHLLDAQTQFWVVRPRISADGVSGLGTLLSGAYIELYPGKSGTFKRRFRGLDQAPNARPGVAGVRVQLQGGSAASLTAGAPVLYKGLKVGQVESVGLSDDFEESLVWAFVERPFDQLLNRSTRFWNASGIDISATANGVQINTQSLASLVAGGISFSTPENQAGLEPVEPGQRFRLYGTQREAEEQPYELAASYVLQFHRSIRGLSVGAPVEYRGIRIGTVEAILVGELAELTPTQHAVPVVIRIEPGRVGLPDSQESVARVRDMIEAAVREHGMRASLQSGSLLTGEQLVAVDYYDTGEVAVVGRYQQYDTLPTVDSGLERIEKQVSELLSKFNSLPLQETVAEGRQSLASLTATLDSLNALLGSEATGRVPQQLVQTLQSIEAAADTYGAGSDIEREVGRVLQQLDATLREYQALANTLEEQPSALILPVNRANDPQPKANP
ncbi:intermembrane transport protein PqiB [Parahaliea mediterranea]|uniref:intermembrane transport protein PqiB n=1 Tax=Parahaliea mediterranea TaxID=651086 RepID=UPI000E2F6FEA|nr:intermembrane transport protein PqiB [Parahaliea mediterranea]